MEIPNNTAPITYNRWQPFYKEILTAEDANEINKNITRFCELALRWNKNTPQNKNNVVEFSKRQV